MTTVTSGVPYSYNRGTKDDSLIATPVAPEIVPQHCPKVYIYAQKGPLGPQLVGGGSREAIYGDLSFDERSVFATHQTVLSNVLMEEGNMHMIERVIAKPEDGLGPRSNLALFLDVLETDLPVYQRNSNGEILKDLMNQPLLVTPAQSVRGYKVKWVIDHVTSYGNESRFASLVETAGDQVDAVSGTQSRRYPILQLWASSYGSYFNDVGIRLFAPTSSGTMPINSKMMSAVRAYPFRIAVIKRPNSKTTGTILSTRTGAPYVEFTLREGVVNPLTNMNSSMSDIFLDSYQKLYDDNNPPQFGDFGGLKVYSENIEHLTDLFYAAESAASMNAVGSDFIGDSDEKWFFNFVSGVSSHGAEYRTFVLNSGDLNSVSLTDQSVHYASGGADGKMDLDLFAALVSERVREYGNIDSPLMQDAVHVESHFYDTGFPLRTKKDLALPLAIRKDTVVVLSTYVAGGSKMSAAEESAMGVSLRNRLRNFPESEFYGTGTCRGVVLMRYGKKRNSDYRLKLPTTIQLAKFSARMMGSADGIWKEGAVFDRTPNNIVSMFDDLNEVFVPASARIADWDAGLNWVEAYSRKANYLPAIRTVYDHDSSVLNNYFTACLCASLEKIGLRIHRMFSGSIRYTERQLESAITTEAKKMVNGRFAGLYRVTPQCVVTEFDHQLGYAWTLTMNFQGNVAKTVQTLQLRAGRL